MWIRPYHVELSINFRRQEGANLQLRYVKDRERLMEMQLFRGKKNAERRQGRRNG
jgi:hypothetical protein